VTAPRVAALLRGINVGGGNRVPMAELRELLGDLGCTEVATYLQSGNAVFVPPKGVRSTRTSDSGLAGPLEQALRERFALDLRVRVTDLDEVEAVVAGNPFGRAVDDPTRVHGVFLERAPDAAALERLRLATQEPNECVVAGAVAYLHYPIGFHAKPVPIERALGMWATARNWRTVLTVRDLLAG
jgi:uncharacterized protein (DUF1697 family)